MSKQKNIRLDSEVDRCRIDSNFRRLLNDLLPQIASKSSGMEHLTNFLTGESLLETFLESFEPPRPDAIYKEPLKKARKFLSAVVDGQTSLFSTGNVAGAAAKFSPVSFDAHLLLAKLYYTCANFDECLTSISKAKIDQDNLDLSSVRTLRLVAEAHAIKGMCLEAQGGNKLTSRFQKGKRREQIIDCFEKCVDLSLQYLRDFERHINSVQYVTGTPAPSSGSLPASITSASLVGGGQSTVVGQSSAMAAAVSTGATASTFVPSSIITPLGRPDRLGFFIGYAMISLPALYIKRQETLKTVEYYRKLLINLDRPYTQQLQQTVCHRFAELLIRGVCAKLYEQPLTSASSPQRKADSLAGVLVCADIDSGSLYGNMPTGMLPHNVSLPYMLPPQRPEASFCPEHRLEEAFLLLSISDTIACKDAVLSRAEDHNEAREKSLAKVKEVQHLLTITLCNVRQYGLLTEMFERAMKFAYDDHVTCLQFALSLLCMAKYSRAYNILKQCLMPSDQITTNSFDVQNQVAKYLMAAKLCVEQLGMYDEGLKHANAALKLAAGQGFSGLVNRAHLLAGLCYSLKAQSSPVYADRQRLIDSALACLIQAQRADSADSVADFFLALQLASAWRLSEASRLCKLSLSKRPEQPVALMLLALLLTADNQYTEALHLVEQALDDFPTHYGLLVLRLKLEMKLQRAGGALLTAKDLLLFWRLPMHSSAPDRFTVGGGDVSSTVNVGGMERPQTADAVMSQAGAASSDTAVASVATGATCNGGGGVDLTDKESVFSSARPLTEYGGAVSTVSDSLGLTASNVSRDVLTQYRMQSNIWLELAELFLNTDDYVDEVQDCCDEACSSFPNSHQVLYLKGRLHHRNGRWRHAKSCFVAALGLCPSHLPSARRLADVYEKEGNFRMAEHVLRQLVNAEPYDHETWKALSVLLAKCQKFKESAQCATTAASLEDSAPIMPFNVIPRILHVQ